MRQVQTSTFGVQKLFTILLVIFPLYTAYCLHPTVSPAAEKWTGVDASVVEKYAKEQGHEAHAPVINTDQGDLLLFVFLLAGTVGGFVAGYYWRVLMAEKTPAATREKRDDDREG